MSGPYRTAEKSTPFESYPVWMVFFVSATVVLAQKMSTFPCCGLCNLTNCNKTAAKGLQPGLARGMMGHIENSCTQGGYTMAERRFFGRRADVLPEVFVKVLQAKELLASGAVSNISAAAKQAGISRSAFFINIRIRCLRPRPGASPSPWWQRCWIKTGALQGLLSGHFGGRARPS